MKRMFRIKDWFRGGECKSGVPNPGDIAHLVEKRPYGYELGCAKWIKLTHTFSQSEAEELPPVFEAGDEVRVKAGSPAFMSDASLIREEVPCRVCFGKKLTVSEWPVGYLNRSDPYFTGEGVLGDSCNPRYLEPWNPAEEWNGSAWVPKTVKFTIRDEHLAKPAIVINRKPDGQLHPATHPHVHASAESARAEAARLAEQHKGEEFVVYQEARSERREKPKSKAEIIASTLAVGCVGEVAVNGHSVLLKLLEVKADGDQLTLIQQVL